MTPEVENKLIDDAYERLIKGYLSSSHRKKVEKIEKAFQFARNAHSGVRRRSGEPYIFHPLAVATIVSQEIGLGSTSICAALLHDVVEDTEYTLEDIKAIFGDELTGEGGEKVGEKIANIVDGLTKISGGIFGDKASAQAENFRKLLMTMSSDIRVVIIKMADRLHNMRTLSVMPPAKQKKITGETMYIYAPLAHRLGLYAIKTELEDLSFKYEHPVTYKNISEAVAASEQKRNEVFERFSAPIRERLDAEGFVYEFKARVKSCYSIWKKMEKKRIPLEEIYDIYAARIVFECPEGRDENDDCLKIYRMISQLYRTHPERTRNWLIHSKPNGYRALHMTVMGPDGDWIEVQIRSRQMDYNDEHGNAVHWFYKDNNGEIDEDDQFIKWYKEIEDILKNPEPNALDFLDSIKLNLYAREIMVFTPKGDMIQLPKNATVLDLAFTLHSEIGEHCIAGKVNHRLVPLSHKLASGDQVEILTSQSQRPQPEWSNFVVTSKGKRGLGLAFRHIRRESIERGEEQFKKFMNENSVEINNENMARIISYMGVQNKEELFYNLGLGKVELTPLVIKALKPASQGLFSKLWRSPFGGKSNKESGDTSTATTTSDTKTKKIDKREVYVLKTENGKSNYQVANCCHPLPGDDVLGYIDKNNHVVVHKVDCPTAMKLKSGFGGRLVETQWETSSEKFFASVRVEGVDRMGILQEIIYLISTNLSINIRRLNITSTAGVFICEMDIYVEDVNTVTKMCKRLSKVKGVTKAMRQT
jgi:GTP pyrophosphokinase